MPYDSKTPTRFFSVPASIVIAAFFLLLIAPNGYGQSIDDFEVANSDTGCSSYVESTADFPTAPSDPTFLVLCEGITTVSGSVQWPNDENDFFSIGTALSPRHRLDAVFLTEYVDGDTGATGNRGFVSLDARPIAEIATGRNVGNFLGVAHLDRGIFPDGTNMLDILGLAELGGQGFTTLPFINENPLTFNIQQTGGQLSNYTLSFHVSTVPEPASGWSWMVVLLASGLLRRKIGARFS